ncbi:hypothetical protein ABVT39_010964 [Epinephelus coioides]
MENKRGSQIKERMQNCREKMEEKTITSTLSDISETNYHLQQSRKTSKTGAFFKINS